MGLLFGVCDDAFFEVTKNIVALDANFVANSACFIREVTFIKLCVLNDLAVRAVIEVMDREIVTVRTACWLVIVLRRVFAASMQFFQKVELVQVDCWTLFDFTIIKEIRDCCSSHTTVADSSCQQVGLDDVATSEMLGMTFNSVTSVSVDETAAVVETLKAVKVASLTNGRNDNVSFDFEFGTFTRNGCVTFHVTFATFQRNRFTGFIFDNFERHYAATNINTFAFRIFALMLGSCHLFDWEQGCQSRLHTFAR